jgi:hypothetical protein
VDDDEWASVETHVAEIHRLIEELRTLGEDTVHDEAMLSELELLLALVRAEGRDGPA